MRAVILTLAVLLTSACASTPAGPYALAGVRNYVEVNEVLSRGAQPTAEGVGKLASLGMVTIINLRGESDHPAATNAEKAAASTLNKHYQSVPLSNWFAPREDDVVRVLRIIDDAAGQPVFVHCQRGADRTGTIVAIYRIMHDCWTAEDAIREAKERGMGWWQLPMRRFIRRWYQSKQPQPCKA